MSEVEKPVEEMSKMELLRKRRDEEVVADGAVDLTKVDDAVETPEEGATPAEDGQESPVAPEEGGSEAPAEPATTDPAAPVEPAVLDREEFEKLLAGKKIRIKVNGESVEVAPDELVRVNGLERHMTKRLQDIAERERELRSASEPKEKPLWAYSEAEVKEAYDQIYVESPYEAQQLLAQVSSARAERANQMQSDNVARSYTDFRTAFPDVTDADWAVMGDEGWYKKYDRDLSVFRSRGDFFGLFTAARNLLREERLSAREKEITTRSETTRQTISSREGAKANATTVRSIAKSPAPVVKKDEEDAETPDQYLARRMGRR